MPADQAGGRSHTSRVKTGWQGLEAGTSFGESEKVKGIRPGDSGCTSASWTGVKRGEPVLTR